MNAILQRTVVLTGGSVRARQSLAAKLQETLLSQSLAFDFFCPATPQDLVDTPANGRHLLWNNPDDTTTGLIQNAWRDQLHELQRNYQSLHADNDNVIEQAVFALINGQVNAMTRPDVSVGRQWVCECCADPACEQQLFGRLLQG